MKKFVKLHLLILALSLSFLLCNEPAKSENIYPFTVHSPSGESFTLEKFKGKTIFVVNTASKCGLTSQYAGLEKLYQKYKERDFIILGFPANDFMGQEPGSNEEIQKFCSLNYQTTFPIFKKISVKGKKQDPLFTWLTSKKSNPKFGGEIKWNFNKFLISKEGRVIARFEPTILPESKIVIEAIENELLK